MSSTTEATELQLAVTAGDLATVERFVADHPDLIAGRPIVDGSWSHRGRLRGDPDRILECVVRLNEHGAAFHALNCLSLVGALKYLPEVGVTLLSLGANPNVTDDEHRTPLHHVAAIGDHVSIRALLSHGAEPDMLSKSKEKPLDVAIRAGHRQTGRMLSDLGAFSVRSDIRESWLEDTGPKPSDAAPPGVRRRGIALWYVPDRWGYLYHDFHGRLFFAAEDCEGDRPNSIEHGLPLTFVLDKDDLGPFATRVRFE
jgi:hypothetical protein